MEIVTGIVAPVSASTARPAIVAARTPPATRSNPQQPNTARNVKSHRKPPRPEQQAVFVGRFRQSRSERVVEPQRIYGRNLLRRLGPRLRASSQRMGKPERVPRLKQRLDVTLNGLRELYQRIVQQQLVASDWLVLGALVLNLIARAEARGARMLAKITASAAASPSTSDPKASDDTDASPASSSSSSDAKATSSEAAASPAAPSKGDDTAAG